MKKILDTVLSAKAFAICYLPYLAINMVTVINILDFTRLFLIFFAVWGVAICAKTFLFGGKTAWTDKWMAVLIAFLALCLVSQLLQFSYGGLKVIGQLCYFALCILVIYAQHKESSEGYKKTLSVVARALGVVIGILMAVSDFMFVNLFSGTVVGRNGVTIKVGFAENRLFGIFSSPNVGGFYALILIWCAVIVLVWAKDMKYKNLWRTLSVIEIVLAVMYISVALSRGTYVSGLTLLISYLIVRAPSLKEKNLAVWRQIAVKAVSIVAAVALSVICINAVNKVSCAVMKFNFERQVAENKIENLEEMQAIIENAELGNDGRVEAGREDIDITNKRGSIWKSHLGLLKGKHLAIGVNNPLIYLEKNLEAGKTFTDEQLVFVRYANGNLHNGYLQILVNGGLLALIPMLVFLVICAVKVIKYLISTLFKGVKTDTAAYALFSVTVPMVLAVLINNVFETNFVLMGANFIQAVFWFAAGACVQSLKEGEKE